MAHRPPPLSAIQADGGFKRMSGLRMGTIKSGITASSLRMPDHRSVTA